MESITTLNARLFGFLCVILKSLRGFESVFEVIQKDHSTLSSMKLRIYIGLIGIEIQE